MMLKAKFAIALALACFATAGCQGHADRSIFDPLNLQVETKPREEKRISVSPNETSFAVQFSPGDATPSEAEQRSALGFIKRRATEPTDEILIDFGILHESTALAHSRREAIAAIVTAAGFDPANVKVRADVRGITENEVQITVRRYLVTLPGCPDFTSRAGRTFGNQPHSNWGCANAMNFGLMLAEPRDALLGRGTTPGDAEALVLSTQRYRAGETRALDVDNTNTAESFGVEGSSGSSGQSQ